MYIQSTTHAALVQRRVMEVFLKGSLSRVASVAWLACTAAPQRQAWVVVDLREHTCGPAGDRAARAAEGSGIHDSMIHPVRWLAGGFPSPAPRHQIVRLSTSLARLVAATSPSRDGRVVPAAGSPADLADTNRGNESLASFRALRSGAGHLKAGLDRQVDNPQPQRFGGEAQQAF